MISLTLKRKDGSTYWQMHFNSQDECDKWLNEEKTRPYWDNEFVSEIVQSPVLETPDPSIEAAKKLKLTAAADALKPISKDKLKDHDLGEVIENILVVIGVK